MQPLTIRAATLDDQDNLRAAVIELQDYERSLHSTRLPGELIAEAYLAWIRERAAADKGAVLIAETDGAFVGFVAGWIQHDDNLAETVDSSHCGYVSDVCVLAAYRGRRAAAQLLDAIERRFRDEGVTRVRIGALAANKSAQACYRFVGYIPYEVIYEKIVGDARLELANKRSS